MLAIVARSAKARRQDHQHTIRQPLIHQGGEVIFHFLRITAGEVEAGPLRRGGGDEEYAPGFTWCQFLRQGKVEQTGQRGDGATGSQNQQRPVQ